MTEIVPVTVQWEVTQPAEGQYVVKQIEEEPQAELNSGNRKGFSFDVKAFKICIVDSLAFIGSEFMLIAGS